MFGSVARQFCGALLFLLFAMFLPVATTKRGCGILFVRSCAGRAP